MLYADILEYKFKEQTRQSQESKLLPSPWEEGFI